MAAEAALMYIKPGMVVGVGTGSTVEYFIDALVREKSHIKGVIASSEATEQKLRDRGFKILSLAEANPDIYVDGADRFNANKELIKGGGGALMREKILANQAPIFICIVDESKFDPSLSTYPLPVEVVPFATASVTAQLERLGAKPMLRQATTDNGNRIIDVHNLNLKNSRQMEQKVNQLTGVVDNGIFAQRKADVILIAGKSGLRTLQ
ncbi:MAG: ribose-5-phosphate isomerase RpiA [Pseudomonadota bacterium]